MQDRLSGPNIPGPKPEHAKQAGSINRSNNNKPIPSKDKRINIRETIRGGWLSAGLDKKHAGHRILFA
jgi:hypothetical protein